MDWLAPEHALPVKDGQEVLVVLDNYQDRRVRLMRFYRGDPNHAGSFYRDDHWFGDWIKTPVKPTDRWMPTPPLPDA